MNWVFISYARADSEFVHELRAALVKGGHEVWLDADELAPSDEWLPSVERALEGARAVVFVASPQSLRSRECMHELRHAAAQGKRIVVLIRDGGEQATMLDELVGAESIDARNGGDFAALLLRLKGTSPQPLDNPP
jgi:hypothetical protein